MILSVHQGSGRVKPGVLLSTVVADPTGVDAIVGETTHGMSRCGHDRVVSPIGVLALRTPRSTS